MIEHKVLLVDDEPMVLAGYQRLLRRQFVVESTVDPAEGLVWLTDKGPFAVVCSDMRMPQMDGVQFLSLAKKVSPETVRIMLTGNLDQLTAMSAVNAGNVFRFLNKPCAPELFSAAISEGIVQHQLMKAEKELLAKTLSGSVSLLTDVLARINPTAFGRAARLRALVAKLCDQLQIENGWEVTIAAMLSQVGCVTVPERTLTKLGSGLPLSAKEEELMAAHPLAGKHLISKIPRLSGVAEIVARQNDDFEPLRTCTDLEEAHFLGGDILKVAIDFDEVSSAGSKAELAIRCLVDRAAIYNPTVMNALMTIYSVSFASKQVEISELVDGMILEEHITSLFGELLVTQGNEVTSSIRERLRNFAASSVGIKAPIRVLCPWLQTASPKCLASSAV